MAHTIMFIPTTMRNDAKPNTKYLDDALRQEGFKNAIYPDFNIDVIEEFFAKNRSDELLEDIAKTRESIAVGKNNVLVQGISLTKPYAADLNFKIASALGAAIIFEVSTEETIEVALRELKIIINPYLILYRPKILGFVINRCNKESMDLIDSLRKTLDLRLPLLGVLPCSLKTEANNIKSTDDDLPLSLDLSSIKGLLTKPARVPLTPAVFKYKLIDLANKSYKKIVLPEGSEPRTLMAANICAERGIAECIMLGDKNEIRAACNQLGINLHNKISIIEPSSVIEKYITPLYTIRRDKGMALETARAYLADNVVLGTMMLKQGDVNGLVSGAIHTTSNTIRPALQIIKMSPGVKLASSVVFMCLPDQVVLFGDCGINENPSAEELANITIQSANTALAFGITPRVAMLSYSTGSSAAGPSVDKVKQATAIAKSLRPDLEIEGPMQYDAAVSKEVAAIKFPESKIAGKATVFIMPDLNVGNIAYKLVQRNTGIVCIGPILQGLNKPVNDLSRGSSVDDIVLTIATTAVQATQIAPDVQ